jgi:hypothetical protein
VEAVQAPLVVLLHTLIIERVQQADRIIPHHEGLVTITPSDVQFVLEVAPSYIGSRVILAIGRIGLHHELAPVYVIKFGVNVALGPRGLVLRHPTARAVGEDRVVRLRQRIVKQVYARIPTT